jgi:glycosyltransferase involved in cell wall biosynthesis
MSSVKEGFPYFLLEAMASGLPIVATNVGGIPEIVNDGKTGFLVPPKNPEALAEKIKLLAKNQDLRQQMGQEGLARVKNKFSQNEMIRKTFTLYQN